MGLFSFFRKDRQQSSASDSDFYSRADEEQTPRPKRKNKRDDPIDPVLPEKKRARRRLVGAVALVLAAIIGLPMILDSEPKPLSDDISIQIPSKDASSAMSQPSKPAASTGDPARASLDDAEEVVEPSTARTDKSNSNAQVASPQPAAVPGAPASATPAATPAPAPAKPPVVANVEPAPAAKPQQPPAIDKNDTSVEAARARAILEGRPADKAVAAKPAAPATTPAANGKISLQVAALASQDKVNELQKKLQSAGLKTYTQKVATASGDRIRVRVGPFANEAEAEKARAKLSSMGLTGTITAH